MPLLPCLSTFRTLAPLLVAMLAPPLLRAQTETRLLPHDGAAKDQFGQIVALSADGKTALIPARSDTPGTDAGSAYVFTRSGSAWTETARLTASDAAAGDQFFAAALSADGQYALVGAQWDDDGGKQSGSAYVFKRSGDGWTETAKLTASDAAPGDLFGNPVALSADGAYAAIAAFGDDRPLVNNGSVYVFARTGDTWTQQAKLAPGDSTSTDHHIQFGTEVALSGDGATALVTGIEEDAKGKRTHQVHFFRRTGASWTEETWIAAPVADAVFGSGLALTEDGNLALVGSSSRTVGVGGGVYVYGRAGGTWAWQTTFSPADGVLSFGESVALTPDGALAFVGAPYQGNGAAYVFSQTGGVWTESARITASDGANYDLFGMSVALSADGYYGLVGAEGDDDLGAGAGSAYVYEGLLGGPPPPSEPDIAAAPLPLGFGSVAVGDTARLVLTISNTGTADLDITSLSLYGADAARFPVPGGNVAATLAPGDVLPIEVQFRPTREGLHSAMLRLNSNDPDESPFDVPLQGTGLPAQHSACTDSATLPHYAGGYVVVGGAAFVPVEVPAGGTRFEFYNTRNLVVGSAADGTGAALPGVTRAGDVFTFSPASPTAVFFPIAHADPLDTQVSFFLRVTDTCNRTVDIDPNFVVLAAEGIGAPATALGMASPNPTAGQTRVAFSLAEAGPVRLTVFDALGREALVLFDGFRSAGPQTAMFDAARLAAGAYFYRLETRGHVMQRVLHVVR